jgi:hypothetical protein
LDEVMKVTKLPPGEAIGARDRSRGSVVLKGLDEGKAQLIADLEPWTMRTEVWRYVSWEDLEDYLRLGWLPTALPEPHGHYRCGCVWRCPCPCVEPTANRQLTADMFRWRNICRDNEYVPPAAHMMSRQ